MVLCVRTNNKINRNRLKILKVCKYCLPAAVVVGDAVVVPADITDVVDCVVVISNINNT